MLACLDNTLAHARKAYGSERVIYAARKGTMNENEDATGKFFIVGSNGWASDAFESFSRAVERLLCIVEDVKIHLAGGSMSYWIEAADGMPLTEKLLGERKDRGTVEASRRSGRERGAGVDRRVTETVGPPARRSSRGTR